MLTQQREGNPPPKKKKARLGQGHLEKAVEWVARQEGAGLWCARGKAGVAVMGMGQGLRKSMAVWQAQSLGPSVQVSPTGKS